MADLSILTGPSCVGKSPLWKALRRFHPGTVSGFDSVVLYNDRPPRPGEIGGVDHHFRRRGEIEALRGDDRYRGMEVRGDLRDVVLDELAAGLDSGRLFFEGRRSARAEQWPEGLPA